MKQLSEFLSIINPKGTVGFHDGPVSGISCRPEDFQKNHLYFLIDEFLEYGHWVRGKDLLREWSPEEAAAVVSDTPQEGLNAPLLMVEDARRAMACSAKFICNAPDEQIRIAGITGTNGKTTTAHLISQWLTACGVRAGAYGTLGLFMEDRWVAETVYTTPLSPELFATISKLKDLGASALALEISSHAMKLDRSFGLDIDAAVFTNLSRDHLDFHETMADYEAAKTRLFTELKTEAAAVINTDDEAGRRIAKKSPCRVIDYGLTPGQRLYADRVDLSPTRTRFRAVYEGGSLEMETALVGRFNLYNTMAALGVCLSFGIGFEALAETCHLLHEVPGRMESIPLPEGRVGIVDYAHTPDSLQKVLETLKSLNPGRILTVFGCGGDRDRGKRPLMGAAAQELSDLCIVTSDNPRREDPITIIDHILTGMTGNAAIVEPDRRRAIRRAFEMSMPGDLILVAGKGHEPYQIIGDERFPFDDREELKCLMKEDPLTV